MITFFDGLNRFQTIRYLQKCSDIPKNHVCTYERCLTRSTISIDPRYCISGNLIRDMWK